MKKFFLETLPDLILKIVVIGVCCFITWLTTYLWASEQVVSEYSSEEFGINYRHEQMMLNHWKYCPYCGEELEGE